MILRKSTHARRSAFTLVELLVVIGIIALLAAIILPAMNAAMRKAETTQAKTEVKSLETALRAYYNEYGFFPTELVGYDTSNAEQTSTGILVSENIYRTLRGENIVISGTGRNPKQIIFMEFPDSSLKDGAFRDPWGNEYKYMLDYNYDNRVHIFFTSNSHETNLYTLFAVWSRGRDGSDEAGKTEDDVRSWE